MPSYEEVYNALDKIGLSVVEAKFGPHPDWSIKAVERQKVSLVDTIKSVLDFKFDDEDKKNMSILQEGE